MLTIIVPGGELYDEETEEFLFTQPTVLELEHSLVSLSKWEFIHEKPFLSSDEKTTEEELSYVECMILNPNFPPEVISRLSEDNCNDIADYINKKATATWFPEDKRAPSREIITSELVYHWIIALQIPLEVQYWHFNRLMTLIRVINAKNEKPKKMSRGELARRNRELNAQRKARLNTTG